MSLDNRSRLALGLRVDSARIAHARLLYRPLAGPPIVRFGWHWSARPGKWVYLGKSVDAVKDGPFWGAADRAEGFRPTDLFALRDVLEEEGAVPEAGVHCLPGLAFLRWVPEGTVEAMRAVLPHAEASTLYRPEEIARHPKAPTAAQLREVFPIASMVRLLELAFGGHDNARRHWRCLADLLLAPDCRNIDRLPHVEGPRDRLEPHEAGIRLAPALGTAGWHVQAAKRPLGDEKGEDAGSAPTKEEERRRLRRRAAG